MKDFPELTFILNGGIQSLKDAKEQLRQYRYTTHTSSINTSCSSSSYNNSSSIDGTSIGDDYNGSSTAKSTRIAVDSDEMLPGVHGVMIGRMAYNNPIAFCTADR